MDLVWVGRNWIKAGLTCSRYSFSMLKMCHNHHFGDGAFSYFDIALLFRLNLVSHRHGIEVNCSWVKEQMDFK